MPLPAGPPTAATKRAPARPGGTGRRPPGVWRQCGRAFPLSAHSFWDTMRSPLNDHLYKLLELLTVVLLLCLLIAGAVGLVRHAQDRAREHVTRKIVFPVLRRAARAYEQVKGRPPAEHDLHAGDPPWRRIAAFAKAVRMLPDDPLKDLPAYAICQVPPEDMPGGAPVPVICDGWGTPLNYVIDDNFGPLFISAGPDRLHNDPDQHDIGSNEPYP